MGECTKLQPKNWLTNAKYRMFLSMSCKLPPLS